MEKQLRDDVARLKYVVIEQTKALKERDAELDKRDEQIAKLQKALREQFGAHGELICQYTDPNLTVEQRHRAAHSAAPYEKPKLGGAQFQQTNVTMLFDRLEARRLTKGPPVIEHRPDPAA
jgi:hypothetical protein